MLSLGVLVGGMVNYGDRNMSGNTSWRLSLGLPAALGFFMAAGAALLPDSPNSLANRGKGDEAERVLKVKLCWVVGARG